MFSFDFRKTPAWDYQRRLLRPWPTGTITFHVGRDYAMWATITVKQKMRPTSERNPGPHHTGISGPHAMESPAHMNRNTQLESAGYGDGDIARIKQQLAYYLDLRETIRRASGESLDVKAYEADMRHLIDNYIEADEPRKISPFDGMRLVDLIVETEIGNAIAFQLGGLKGNKEAIAETIENNVRRKIIKEQLTDPAYYERMSALLEAIIAARKAKAIVYEEYLGRIAELAKNVKAGHTDDTPEELSTPGMRALYNNLGKNADLAVRVEEAVKRARHDAWRGHSAREMVIKQALYEILPDETEVERVFLIIKGQRES